MAELGYQFDARTVDPATSLEPLPTDWYDVMITQSQNKPTKANDGGYLELGMKVISGPFAGRMLFDRLNLWNQSAIAVEIANKTLSSICHATGVFVVTNSEQLHGVPMQARAVLRPAKDGYDASNDIKGYRAIGSGAGPTVAPAAAGAAPVTPPWAAAQPAAPVAAPPVAPAPVAPAPVPVAPPAAPPVAPPVAAPPQQFTPPAAPPAGGVTPPWAR